MHGVKICDSSEKKQLSAVKENIFYTTGPLWMKSWDETEKADEELYVADAI